MLEGRAMTKRNKRVQHFQSNENETRIKLRATNFVPLLFSLLVLVASQNRPILVVCVKDYYDGDQEGERRR